MAKIITKIYEIYLKQINIRYLLSYASICWCWKLVKSVHKLLQSSNTKFIDFRYSNWPDHQYIDQSINLLRLFKIQSKLFLSILSYNAKGKWNSAIVPLALIYSTNVDKSVQTCHSPHIFYSFTCSSLFMLYLFILIWSFHI